LALALGGPGHMVVPGATFVAERHGEGLEKFSAQYLSGLEAKARGLR